MALPEKPLTRRETYLAKAAGQEVTLPETDLTREEQYLRAIAEGGGGGSTSPFYPAGNTAFVNLPELSTDIIGAMYNVTDAFTTDSRFNEGAGVKYPAGTNVAVVNIGTEESPTLKFDTYTGAYTVDDELSDSSENPVQNKVITAALGNKADTSALNNYVEKEAGKSLSTNDYTDTDKALVQDSPITVTATGAEITASTAQGNLNALTIYGKSEVVDGAITSAGEGWSTVDLGALTWYQTPNNAFYALIGAVSITDATGNAFMCTKYRAGDVYNLDINNAICLRLNETSTNTYAWVRDTAYTTPLDFKTAMSGVLLCYQLADPTQGNAIAVKTDNGSGIDGTMATFTTGTPLRGIPDTTVRDSMAWDGSSGAVTKNCGRLKLSDYTWTRANLTEEKASFYINLPTAKYPENRTTLMTLLISDSINFQVVPQEAAWPKGTISCQYIEKNLYVTVEPTIQNNEQLQQAYGDLEIIYELATPTTEQLTSTENTSIAALRTFEPQTHIQNNAGATMTIEAYASTENGKAVNELKQDVQSEISALKITQSGTLTLTTAGWTNNTQTVTYAHDTAKRNVIDVDPTSVEEWASCGILATAETASGITFKCSTVPENALNFRVTSMGVN